MGAAGSEEGAPAPAQFLGAATAHGGDSSRAAAPLHRFRGPSRGGAWLRVCVLGPTARPALWTPAAALGGPQKATTARTSTFSMLSAERQAGFASQGGGGGAVGGAEGLQFRRPEKRLCRTRARLGKAPSACA